MDRAMGPGARYAVTGTLGHNNGCGIRLRPDLSCSRPKYTVFPFQTCDHAALPTSSSAKTTTTRITASQNGMPISATNQ